MAIDRWMTKDVAKSLQSCLTLCNPIDGSPPESHLSLGFSRQEHWSGLPFPSPMHESGKWKGSRSVMSDSSRPHGLQPTRLLHPWDFPGKSTGVGCHRLLRWMRRRILPICKKVTNENSAIARLSHCASSVVKTEQLKGHHTIYKPAGRSHPDFALPNPFWAMIRQVLIDDILK